MIRSSKHLDVLVVMEIKVLRNDVAGGREGCLPQADLWGAALL